ncbi:MAG: hypothetical protein EXR62_15405 [Chloroflexi bacterium]|nr:hypothetical protein [Chloroflexota bacterium]
MAETLAGKRPVDEKSYPYFPPAYAIPFLHIGTDKQLFLDNFILDHLEDVTRVFPTPERPEKPIIDVGNLPWEERAREVPNIMPSGIVHDPEDGKYKIWYILSLSGDPFSEGQVLCYAESTDCLHWEKPLSAAGVPFENHAETNIVWRDTAHVAVVLNHDRSDPERKFLMLYNPLAQAKQKGRRFISQVAASPDGWRWKVSSEDTLERHHHTPRVIWDDAIQQWIAYSQYSHHWNFLYRKRQIGRQESPDFIHWSPKEVVLSADWDPNLPPDLEYHDMSVRKIGGLYIGLATEFMAEPVWNVRTETNWRDIAHARQSLQVSRDGKRWVRVGGPGPWMDNRRPGSMDYGFANFTAPGQFICNGKTYIPYDAVADKQHWYGKNYKPPTPLVPEQTYEKGRMAWEHLGQVLGQYPRQNRSIGVLILREDGWAELKPAYEHGRVYTKQFVFEGNTLKVNADCYGGYLQVEILDPNFQPYPGFSAAECDPVYSDNRQQIWHTAHWQGNADVRNLWNKPCRLRFDLHQASLYAFQFEDQ